MHTEKKSKKIPLLQNFLLEMLQELKYVKKTTTTTVVEYNTFIGGIDS